MSLQVWLTGNNSMNNQGLLGDLTQTTAPTYVDGKLGKAMSTGGYKMTAEQTAQVLNNEAVSICFWVYINADTGTTNNRVMFFGNESMGSNNNRKFSLFNYPTVNDFHWFWMNDNNALLANTLSGVLPSYQWTHVAVTYQNPNATIYINGEKVITSTGVSNSSTFAYETQVIHNSSYLRWNDYRIYNECISAKTVKEISKGLVCHYKLSGVGGENLIPKSRINNRGCTSFVYDEATNVYDCIAPAGSTGWGYGIVFSRGTPEIPVGIGETICFSLEVKPDIDCRWQCDVNNAVADGSVIGGNDYDDISLRTTSNKNIVAGVWNKVYWTYTAKDYDLYDADSNWGIVTSGVTNEIHFQIRNIKVEYGSSPTPWCPNPSDTLYSTLGYNDRIEYDCSGYGNNGTKVGNIAWSSDSPRYSGSYIPTTNSSYISTTLNTPGYANSYTISYWAKISNMDNKMVFGFGDGDRLNLYPTNSIFCWNTGDGAGNPFKNNGTNVTFASYNGAWHHYCITGNGTTTTLYIDGEKKGTAQTYRAIIGTKLFLSGWDTGASYKWTGGNISDFRLYSTCLSAEDIKALYNVSASIDKTGVLSAYEFVEEG